MMRSVPIPVGVFKDVLVNQLLGVPPVRRWVDSVSARPVLGPLQREAGDIWDDPCHPELALRKWRRLLPLCGPPGWLRGRVVLEIGPGMSLGMGIVGVALGARRCILADAERHVTSDPRVAASHRQVLDLVPLWFPDADPRHRTTVSIDGDAVVPDGELLEYRIEPVERLSLEDDSVDVTTSHSLFEHLRELDPAIAQIARVTSPGGLGLHQIDLADHLHPDDPLHMLTCSRRVWELMASNRRGWTNRLRLPAYIACFERHGLEVEKVEVTRSLPDDEIARVRPRLHPDHRGLDDDALRPLTALCVLRRRP